MGRQQERRQLGCRGECCAAGEKAQGSRLGDGQVDGLLPAEAPAAAAEIQATCLVCAVPAPAVQKVERHLLKRLLPGGHCRGCYSDSVRVQRASRRCQGC